MKTSHVVMGIAVIGIATFFFVSHSVAGPDRCGGYGHRATRGDSPSCGAGWACGSGSHGRAASSQGARHGHGKGDDFGRHGRMMSLLLHLELTPQQSDKLRDTFKTHMPQFIDQAWQMAWARQRLAKLAHDESVDEDEIRATADQLGQAIADTTVLKSNFHRAIQAVLTPDQKDRLKEMKHHRCPQRGPATRPWADQDTQDD